MNPFEAKQAMEAERKRHDAVTGLMAMVTFAVFVALGAESRRRPKTAIAIAMLSLPLSFALWIYAPAAILYVFLCVALLLGLVPITMVTLGLSGLALSLFFPAYQLFAIPIALAALAFEVTRHKAARNEIMVHMTLVAALGIPLYVNCAVPAAKVIPEETLCRFKQSKFMCDRENEARRLTAYLSDRKGAVDTCGKADIEGTECLRILDAATKEYPAARIDLAKEMCQTDNAIGCTVVMNSDDRRAKESILETVRDACKYKSVPAACDAVTAYYLQELQKDKRSTSAEKTARGVASDGCAAKGGYSCFNFGVLKIQAGFPSGIFDMKTACDLGFKLACETIEKIKQNWTADMCPTTIGLNVVLDSKTALVRSVEPGSKFEVLGVKPQFSVDRIGSLNGLEVTPEAIRHLPAGKPVTVETTSYKPTWDNDGHMRFESIKVEVIPKSACPRGYETAEALSRTPAADSIEDEAARPGAVTGYRDSIGE